MGEGKLLEQVKALLKNRVAILLAGLLAGAGGGEVVTGPAPCEPVEAVTEPVEAVVEDVPAAPVEVGPAVVDTVG